MFFKLLGCCSVGLSSPDVGVLLLCRCAVVQSSLLSQACVVVQLFGYGCGELTESVRDRFE